MRLFVSLSLPFLLALAFSALPTTAAFACGKGADCCSKEVKKAAKSCCDTHGDHEEKNGCSGDCGKKGCPCPSSALGAPAALPAEHPALAQQFSTETRSKADWYFLNKIPAAVYLSVWLPPKI